MKTAAEAPSAPVRSAGAFTPYVKTYRQTIPPRAETDTPRRASPLIVRPDLIRVKARLGIRHIVAPSFMLHEHAGG